MVIGVGPLWSSLAMEQAGQILVFSVTTGGLALSFLMFIVISKKVGHLIRKNNKMSETAPLV